MKELLTKLLEIAKKDPNAVESTLICMTKGPQTGFTADRLYEVTDEIVAFKGEASMHYYRLSDVFFIRHPNDAGFKLS
jgi:hypothetical protein